MNDGQMEDEKSGWISGVQHTFENGLLKRETVSQQSLVNMTKDLDILMHKKSLYSQERVLFSALRNICQTRWSVSAAKTGKEDISVMQRA